MVPSIAPSTDTNNGVLGRAARSARKDDSRARLERHLDAHVERIAAIASQVADQVADLLLDDFLTTLEQAAGSQATEADLARAVARASARSARLTVYVVANPPESSCGSSVAAAVRGVLRHPLPNQEGADVDCAAVPYDGTKP